MGHDQSKSNDDEVQKPAGISGGSETEAERRKSLDHVVESRREDEDEDGGTQTEDDEGDHFNLLILSPMLTQVRVDEQQDEVEPDKGEGKKKTTKEMVYYGVIITDAAGEIWWARNNAGPWHPATFFTADVRRYFLEKMEKVGKYKHTRPMGTKLYDETSFHRQQEAWTSEQGPDRPPILSVVNKPAEEQQSEFGTPDLLHYGKRFVLAQDYRPIINRPELPLTLSSEEPGYSLEAMTRSNQNIILKEFLDRMPIGTKLVENGLNMRMHRYRKANVLEPWHAGKGRRNIKTLLDDMIARHKLEKPNHWKSLDQMSSKEPHEGEHLHHGRSPDYRDENEDFHTYIPRPPPVFAPSVRGRQGRQPCMSTGLSRDRSRSPPSERLPYRRRSPPVRSTGEDKRQAARQARASAYDYQETLAKSKDESFDWRKVDPRTNDEVRIVHHAIVDAHWQVTRVLEGKPTPRPTQHHSYDIQWTSLSDFYLRHCRLKRMKSIPGLGRHGPTEDKDFPRHFLLWDVEEPPYEK